MTGGGLGFNPEFQKVMAYVTYDGTIDADDKKLIETALESDGELDEFDQQFLNGMQSGLSLRIAGAGGEAAEAQINLEIEDDTSIENVKSLLKNGVSSENELNMLNFLLTSKTIAEELLNDYKKTEPNVNSNRMLIMDYAKTVRKFVSDIQEKITSNSDFDDVVDNIPKYFPPDSVEVMKLFSQVTGGNVEKNKEMFLKAMTYELTMEIYYKRSGEEPMGVILQGNSDDWVDDWDMIGIANDWGKEKEQTIIIPFDSTLTLSLIMNDERLDSLATIGHGNPDSISLQDERRQTNFLTVPQSQTIKNITMLNCNSAYVLGLEQAFPNAESWNLNNDTYLAGFGSTSSDEPLREKYSQEINELRNARALINTYKKDLDTLEESNPDYQKALRIVRENEAIVEKIKEENPELEGYIEFEFEGGK